MGKTGASRGQGPDRVLREIRAAGSITTLADLQERTGLHENTLRKHLDVLVQQGRLTRLPLRRGGRGRPRWGYLPRENEYAGLALALAEGLSAPGDPALVGGRRWGRRLADQLHLAEAAQDERLRLVLTHTGFPAEEADPDGDDEPATVRLTHCPLQEAARAHPDVVCRVHQGMLEGALGGGEGGEAATPPPGVELLPFAEPGACLVRLS